MSGRGWRKMVWVVLVAPSLACQASIGTRVRADVHAFQKERSLDKLMDRGRAFAAVGDTTRAEEYLSAALDAGGDEAAVTPLLLSVCVRDGRYRMAIEYARSYLVRHPSDRRLRFVLGTLYAAVGESASAQHELEHVARADRDNADVQYALAVVLRDQQSDPSRADQHFREYLRLAPGGEHADEARASLLQEVP
jgi:predicted Zn-dependent protease